MKETQRKRREKRNEKNEGGQIRTKKRGRRKKGEKMKGKLIKERNVISENKNKNKIKTIP
jgi:hypothetical protein